MCNDKIMVCGPDHIRETKVWGIFMKIIFIIMYAICQKTNSHQILNVLILLDSSPNCFVGTIN